MSLMGSLVDWTWLRKESENIQYPLDIENMSKETFKTEKQGFPGGEVVENLPASAGDTGSSPGLGRSHMPRSN